MVVFLTERFLFREPSMAELVRIYRLGPPGAFPQEGVRMWLLPSAAKHVTPDPAGGGGVSLELRAHWEQRRVDYDSRVTVAVGKVPGARPAAQKYDREKLQEPYWELFEFVADEWDAFLKALTSYPFDVPPLDRAAQSKKKLAGSAEQVAVEICRDLTAESPTRVPPAARVVGAEPEGFFRMGGETTEMIKQLKTFWYVGYVLERRDVNSLALSELETALWDDYGYVRVDKTIGKDLKDLEGFFARYYELDHPGEECEFIVRRAGRRPELLEGGWEMWRETKKYAQSLGWSKGKKAT